MTVRVFATDIAPIDNLDHALAHVRDPAARAWITEQHELWTEHGPTITVPVDELETAFFANRDGGVLCLDLPPVHTKARQLLEAAIARGDLAQVDEADVETIVVDRSFERQVGPGGRFTEIVADVTTTYRLRDGAPRPRFATTAGG